jgi:hypothetical protein
MIRNRGESMVEEEQPFQQPHIVLREDRPLIGVLAPEENSGAVTYFTDEDDADQGVSDAIIERALSLAGVWSDVPWDDIESGLDQIRHASEPAPPLEP